MLLFINSIFVTMSQLKIFTGFYKQLLLVFLLVFSLVPCTVKAVVFNSVNVVYTQPHSKSKATASISVCNFTTQQDQALSITKNIIDNAFKAKPIGFIGVQYLSNSYFPKYLIWNKQIHIGEPEPKYILFKQLKVDAETV